MAVASMVGCSFCLDLTFTGPLDPYTTALLQKPASRNFAIVAKKNPGEA
jgi:hypothetical protein